MYGKIGLVRLVGFIGMYVVHLPNGWSVRHWPREPGFNPRLNHTKDSKNGT